MDAYSLVFVRQDNCILFDKKLCSVKQVIDSMYFYVADLADTEVGFDSQGMD